MGKSKNKRKFFTRERKIWVWNAKKQKYICVSSRNPDYKWQNGKFVKR